MENENYQDKWAKARENADITFQSKYVARVLSTLHPPKAYVRLEGEGEKHIHLRQTQHHWIDMHKPDNDCAELTEETANAIDDFSLQELFVSSQMSNLNLCVKSALRWEPCINWKFKYWQTSESDMSWNMVWSVQDSLGV